MLTFVFLFAIAIMVLAGIFIAIQARRRGGRGGTQATMPGDNKPAVERAIPDND